jgi:hypothetical protein
MSSAARLRRRVAILAVALAPLVTGPLAANSQGFHPLPDLRPLDARLPQADRVVFGTVDEVEMGRVRVREAVAVLGSVEPEFALKRSPSSPPPLESGDRALLLLRGARPPYVLVDRPQDVVPIGSAEEEEIWRAAVIRLSAALGEPSERLAVYLEWLDGASDGLRSAAQRALVLPDAAFFPLPDDVVASRVNASLDPEASEPTRTISAGLAVRSESGAAMLLSRVPGTGNAADPVVTSTALRAGIALRSEQTEAALLRALRHADVEIRRVGVRFSAYVQGRSARVSEQLKRMAEQEPEARLREEIQALVAPAATEPAETG